MLLIVLIGCGLAIVTTFVHSLAMMAGLWALRSSGVRRWIAGSAISKAAAVSSLVLIMLLATVIESGIYAGTYLAVGAMDDIETTIYFSMVTYTTLGYGDVVMHDQWRLLASFEAANGIIMFGWTTALIFASVHLIYLKKEEAGSGGVGGI